MTFTKEDIQTKFGLSDDDFKETIKAIGCGANKKNFTEEDMEKITTAREYIDSGAASSYEDLASIFKQQSKKSDSTLDSTSDSTSANPGLIEDLDKRAVHTGVELGKRQAAIINQTMTVVAIQQLREMAESGAFDNQLRTAFFGESGPTEIVDVVSTHLTDSTTQEALSPSSTTTNMLPSSEHSEDSTENTVTDF